MWNRRHSPPRQPPRRLPAGGRVAFTLIEMLVVVGVMATVAGMLVLLTAGMGQRTDRQMVQAESAEIRRAILRFQADMGSPPRYLAELMQPPDPSDTMGGWWWRTGAEAVPADLHDFDPATGRGWDGPYLQADSRSTADDSTAEARLVSPTAYGRIASDAAAGRRLSITLSRYATYPQATDAGRAVSHYQMDASDAGGLAVRFVRDPLAAPQSAGVVVRLDLGVPP